MHRLARRTLGWLALALLATTALPAPAQDEPPTSPGPPPETLDPNGKYRIDPNIEMFRDIRDDAPFPWTQNVTRDPDDYKSLSNEERAYDEVLKHARQFSAAELEAHARRDLTLKDLRNPGRASFKLNLVYFEGRLKMLRRLDLVSKDNQENGISAVYEGYLFPKDEVDPICVIVTDLPPGLEPQKDLRTDEMNRWVGVAGYSFKLLRYEAKKYSRSDPGTHEIRRAPVLIGRAFTLPYDPAAGVDPGRDWRETFVPLAVAGFGGVGLAVVGCAWWFRRGDRAVRTAIAGRLQKNPFSE